MGYDMEKDRINKIIEKLKGMEIKKIYFDMDGVLADFDRGVREFCHMEPSPQNEGWKPGMDDNMWAKARLVDHYYDKLELMPGAKEMFDLVYGKYKERCEILTGIPKPKRGMVGSAEDKKAWTKRLLSEDIIVNTVYREEKPDYCSGKDCILIDDLKANIASWEEIGGTGILFENAQDIIEIFKAL
ncbi:MAG: hypothetical protein K6E10_00105 [Eubacterium sp.]|nr:hypothetical protein [Eubacterium sp.]